MSPKGWAAQVKKLRISLDLSQGKFARILGVTPVAISQWERGAREPSTGRYIQLAKMCASSERWYFLEKAGLSRSDLYRRDGDRRKKTATGREIARRVSL